MKTRIRQGLLAGLALAAILVMPGIGGAAPKDWDAVATGSTKTDITVNGDVSADTEELTMNDAGTLLTSVSPLGAKEANTLTVGSGGTFKGGGSGKELTVSAGGTLSFLDGSTFTSAGTDIALEGGIINLTIGSGYSGGSYTNELDALFVEGTGIKIGAGGTLNVNFDTDVDSPAAIAMGSAEGGTVNINIGSAFAIGATGALGLDVGAADLLINPGSGSGGTAAFGAVTAGNVTVVKGENSFDGTVGATYTNSVAISATAEDITINGGNIVIQSGENTFAGTVTASHTHTANDIAITGDGDIAITGGNIDVQGGTNTFTGNVTAGYTHTAGNITISGDGDISITGGDINISGGDNTFQGTVTASYTHTTGDITISSQNVDPAPTGGNINISGGTNTFENSLTATSGALAFTGGQNTFDGSITLTALAGTDINFGAATFNLADGAGLTGANNLVFANAMLNAQGASTLSAASNNITFSGATIDLGSNALTVSADSMAFTGNNTIQAYSDGTDSGKLTVTATGVDLTNSGNIALNLTENAKGDWTGMELIDLGATVTGDPKFTFASGSKRYELIYNEVAGTLTFGEPKAPNLEEIVGSANMTPNLQAASGMINNIIESGNPALAARLDAALEGIYGLENEAEMKVAASQLIGESTLGARQAAAESAFKTQGAVLGRLDKIHSQGGHTPPAAGDRPDNNRLWLGGFGSWNKQKNADDVFGYDYNLSGLALGYDHELDGAPLTLGVVSSLSFGKIENNNGRDSIETDTVSLGLYGSYRFESGLFVDANLGYGHSRNESTVNWVLGGQKTGNFDIDSWQAGARTGYIFDLSGFNLTPSLGLRYLYTKQGAWSESLDQAAIENSAVGNKFNSTSDSQLEIPLHLTANTTIDAGSLRITPELRAGVNYAAKEADNKLQMGFVGADETITLQGVKPPRTSFLAGTGLKIKLNDTMDVFVNYDLTTASGFTGHNASAGLGFQF